MRKEKLIAGGLGITMVATMVVVGFVIWNATKTEQTITLNNTNTSKTPSTSGGLLDVANNNGIGGGISGQGQSLGSAPSSQTNSSSQKQEDFAQYDKYKDSKSALFGEIKAGTGPEAKAQNTVGIYYKGYLTNGQVFDNQWPGKPGDKPKPFEFQIGTDKIIAGLQQGIVGMKVGGMRRIIIPPSVGYGEKGQGAIPPDSVLVMDVELLSVK